ncbi:hypothetical protein [Pseudomonas sp. NFACC37-1]|uniref:hypothetical protein n=1 Tax=Pseudomonas sp. NFACC37-1 TaxID=1566196 RepID=UPI0008866A7C|nr:hypothetical protein [Pseudomonas sp. NFACC37-1]SCZ13297.1 hypothetical protein SAMN03159391_05812 [Pseudomonas sp. NFACC37-1]
MRSFNLLARLLGRSADPVAPAEQMGPPQAVLEGAGSVIMPQGAVLVRAPEFPEAERIAQSIREFPEDWTWARKGFDIQHVPSGFRIWVANDDYGLAEVHDNNGKTDFSKPEQAIIWPAVADWLGHRKVGFTGRLPKARITGRSGTFWCYAKEHPWAGVGESPEEAYRAWRHAISSQARSDMKPNEYLQVRSATL